MRAAVIIDTDESANYQQPAVRALHQAAQECLRDLQIPLCNLAMSVAGPGFCHLELSEQDHLKFPAGSPMARCLRLSF